MGRQDRHGGAGGASLEARPRNRPGGAPVSNWARTTSCRVRDRDFAGLYPQERGRPSVPPSQLCVALLLQAREAVSDDEAIQRTAYDLRWQVALGLDVDEKLCAKSTLQLFRAKLILHDQCQSIFKASIEACRNSGLMKRKQLEVAIDTTPVFGRGAVKDTFNLISDQILCVVKEVVALKDRDLSELVASNGLSRHFEASFKGAADLDWDDAGQRRACVGRTNCCAICCCRTSTKIRRMAVVRRFGKARARTASCPRPTPRCGMVARAIQPPSMATRRRSSPKRMMGSSSQRTSARGTRPNLADRCDSCSKAPATPATFGVAAARPCL